MHAMFTLKGDSPEDYAALVELACAECSFFLVVVRRLRNAGPQLRMVIEDLREDLRDTSERSGWPGTRLIGHTATVYTFHLSKRSAAKLLRWTSRFSEWIAPDRPEDLAFLRADESVWLGSVAHEKDVFLKLTSDELSKIQSAHPLLARKLLRDA